MNPLAHYSDMRLVRVLKGLDRRVGPLTRALRELILAEMGRRVAAAYASERRRMHASLRAKWASERDPVAEHEQAVARLRRATIPGLFK